VVRWLAGDPAAGSADLRARLERDPLDWRTDAWLARLFRRDDSFGEAIRYARWAVVVQADVAVSILFEKQIDVSREAPYAGLDRAYPTGVYLRPPSPYLPMPQLVTIRAP
jgi:hypothetical protein